MANLKEAALAAALQNRYRLERELGQGGMATVYLAHDLKHDRLVALKVVRPELAHALGLERFQREIHLAARLQHPHICSVYDSGALPADDTGGAPPLWFTMPYVEGESLRDRLRRESRLPVADALRIAHETGQALQYAHDKGVVHRDIKPENLLLADDGSVLVADFGIARPAEATLVGGNLTATGVSLGTPTYMAPEQATGDRRIDGRADQYALAATLFEMLAGRPPHVAETGAALIAQRFSTPAPGVRSLRPEVPGHVEAALTRALSLDPDARFASVSEFLQALDRRETDAASAVSRKRMGARIAVSALVLLLVIAAVALLRGRTGATSADRTRTETRIAVLPFTLLGGDTTGSYMAEGLADEIMTSLAQVRGLRVAPRSAAARFAGQPVRDAARALEVDAVMEGSVRRAGDRLRVSAQLTSAEDGLVVWARSFDRAAGDAFTLQEDIARELVAALRDTLGAATTAVTTTSGSVDPQAYDLFLRGRFFWSRRGAALPTAIDYFAQAVARDPRFARAKAGLAISYQSLAYYGGGRADSLMALAEPMALAALQLDSTLADAHLALGGVRRYQWRWADAERHLRRAADLAPDDATAHQWLGGVLYATGRAGDAVGEMRQARRLDPFSAAIAGDAVYTLLVAGDTAMTREAARMMELDTTLAVSHMIAGLVALWNGRPDEALRALATAHELRNAPELRGFEVAALRAAGRNAAAERLYRELLRALAQGTAANADAAYAAAAMGDTERVFALLDRMVERHEPLVTEISVPCDPGFAALHGDPRFAALLSRAGMQPCRR